ncbi:MAG: UDP-N-acetylmuramoyl-tripeptide--D-alanyl-D-alanine ligase [Bryobacterales bacterium]|jgi:UDP-N-acetylmuramoyl-tripeptide--D-alanyl-D-alanine ligase|nr:UDP-N-acetylmuramoyl-tripeptide--D-alanyl-D-alanine ligase [Bryobacterales bacterium]
MNKPLRWVAAQLGLAIATDAQVTGWSIDSRTLRPGDLFFALRGPNHDGHRYVAEVLNKGAVGAIVDRDVDSGAAPAVLKVKDTLAALQTVASSARQEWPGDVVGVTGSAGKTTTKDVIAEMLSEGFKTAKTEGNLNNHVGLPLSLLRVDDQARVAVLEMGMNHAGEIRALAEIARPNVGVVTNVGAAHMESFDSIEGIAAAKRELIEALPANGTAVLNADDPLVAAFASIHRRAHKGPVVTYGESERADVRAEDVRFSEDGLAFRVGAVQFESVLIGRHSVSNLLAGIAVARIYGIAPDRLAERVRNIQPGKMRGERFRHQGMLVFNDCYNSNPDAARAMLAVLRDTPARRRVAVLGEMLELGRWAEPLHRAVGNYAAECGIDVLVGLRGAACFMLDAAKRSGLRADAAFFFDDPVPAGQLVRSLAQPGDAILFKGSRGVHVELALEQFLASQEGGKS